MFTEGIFPIGDGLLDIDEERLKGLLVQDDINEIYDVEQTPFARGKFAAVRRAVHKNSGVHFAAKFLKRRRRAQSSDKEIKHEIAVLMLCEEADNIVKLNAVHESRSDTALLLELATGGELQTFLDNEECLNEAQARICMREVLKALQFLHNRSIAHLDLKPQNILLAGEHIEDGLKLCDFGISRVVAEGTNVREIVGTPDYVAPEVLQYEPLSLLTDIWSVGVLTYVLLSGFSPFGGDTKQETFLNISQCALTFPEKLFAGVSAPAIDFIRRALRIKPSDRMTAAGCLEHIWLKDECSIDRQIFNNISKKAAATSDNDVEDEDGDDGVEEDEDEEEQDESFEEDLVELIEEEEEENVSMEENGINGHKMDSSDAETHEFEPINALSNGKIDYTSSSAKSSNIPLMSKSVTYSATNGTTNNATKMNAITIPLSNNTVTSANSTTSQHHQQHVAARRHSSDANKENTFVAVKKINNLTTAPPPIAKKPTITTATAKIVIATPTTASTTSSSANQVVSSITIPTVATADKHSNNIAVSCIFPDAPTTPKVIRKAPATDNSPTSVKALVKKFQLEGSSSNSSSRATSPAPSPAASATTPTAGIATVHLKEPSQQNQQMHINNGRCCATTQRRASTNTINGSNSRDIERTTTAMTSTTNGRKSTTSLPNDVATIVHQTSAFSSASSSSKSLSLKKSSATTNAATTTTVAVTNGSSYKTTCVLCLTCSDNSSNSNTTANNSSTNGCRHTLAGSKVAIVSHNNSNSSNSSSSSSCSNNSNNSNNSANSTAAAILLSNHKQLQQHHHHHHHVHHAVHHHVHQKGAANNLSLDQGIIC